MLSFVILWVGLWTGLLWSFRSWLLMWSWTLKLPLSAAEANSESWVARNKRVFCRCSYNSCLMLSCIHGCSLSVDEIVSLAIKSVEGETKIDKLERSLNMGKEVQIWSDRPAVLAPAALGVDPRDLRNLTNTVFRYRRKMLLGSKPGCAQIQPRFWIPDKHQSNLRMQNSLSRILSAWLAMLQRENVKTGCMYVPSTIRR